MYIARGRLLQFVHRLAAAAVVCAFAALPPLTRAYDRLSSSDKPTAFKISKNLERPHEKMTPAPIVRAGAAALVGRDDQPAGPVSAPVVRAHAALPLRPTLDRAPPAR